MFNTTTGLFGDKREKGASVWGGRRARVSEIVQSRLNVQVVEFPGGWDEFRISFQHVLG